MRVVHDDLQLLVAVKLLNVENRMFAGHLLRVLPESSFVPDLDRLPPEEERRADVVHVHQEGRAHQLESLRDSLGIVHDLDGFSDQK